MRTSLVTGAAGFVGSAVAEALLSRGDRVVCLANAVRDLHHAPILKRAAWIYGSVTDERLVRDTIARFEPAEVYHFAAASQVRSGARDPGGTVDVNVMGVRNVLEACRTTKDVVGAILVASSDKAYGEPPTPAKEVDGLFPLHIYDASKASCDFLAQAYARDFDMPIIVTRSCNIYGPGDLNWGRIFPNTCARLVEGRPPILHQGVDLMERQFVFIGDYVRAALLLTAQARTLPAVPFNVGGEVIRVRTLVERIIKASGKPFAPEITAVPFKELKAQSVDATRLRSVGWVPLVNLERGVGITYDWYQDYLGGVLR